MTITAIMQPVYIPWLGYFEQILRADHFIFLDDAQYTKQNWRNRNRIRTATGWQWLTIPVSRKNLNKPIHDVKIANSHWKRKHLASLQHNYGKCRFYDDIRDIFEQTIMTHSPLLVDMTIPLIQNICAYLDIAVPHKKSSDIPRTLPGKQERLIQICQETGSNILYIGPAASDYIDLQYFENNGIKVQYQEYKHPSYKQAYTGFQSHMSIIDVLMNHGPSSRAILE